MMTRIDLNSDLGEGFGVAEAFADRAYTPQGTLVARREPGVVLASFVEVS